MIRAVDLPWRDPEDAFALLCDLPHPVWLDSGGPVSPRSRFCFLAVDPFRILEIPPGTPPDADPFARLVDLLHDLPPTDPPPPPFPFAGGLLGTLGYDLRRHVERLPGRHGTDPALPALWAGAYDLVLAWDRAERSCRLFSSGLPEREPAARARRAERRAAFLLDRLHRAVPDADPLPPLCWLPSVSPVAHQAAVAACIRLIAAGDLFQANITARYSAPRPPALHLPSVQRHLHRRCPAPFSAFVGWGGGRALLSASPERFLLLSAGGEVETRPIKGTRPRRPADPDADRAEAAALLRSAKDRAENLMIVDLMRNDLSRVCSPGTVRVPELCALESFPTVHHLVSTVSGRLRPGLAAPDLLRASFPGGSITGAPKIRAMEVIDALEADDRGLYCGSVFRLGLDGALDSSIVIRSIAATPDRLLLGAGGGIVSDSDPAAELAELRLKAAPLLSLFSTARPDPR
ncbi:MAG: anthranilate synthase component I family protein [Gluconacetobacter diazotrophicus]|nr:anthranilate synthase component I family protein [Gluconacetobacter diazotrophicus]